MLVGNVLLLLVSCNTSEAFSARPTAPLVGLVSFDLDDTLFPIQQVVDEANCVQMEYMNELLSLPKDGAITLEDFLQTTRTIRSKLETKVTYTTLRKAAIRQQLEQATSKRVANSMVDQVFDVWLRQRQQSAQDHLFDETLSTLASIRKRHSQACVCAITNGRGNPLEMELLQDFFDFCVSGEDANVFPNAKPHPHIYEIALQKYRTIKPHHSHDTHIWYHVGDCLANDVGASADCGAFAVWYKKQQSQHDKDDKQPSWSTASQQEVNDRQKLATQAQAKVSATISRLSELLHVLDGVATLPTTFLTGQELL